MKKQLCVRKHNEYKGKRIKRGLFKSSNGTLINADLNGSLNIIRKVVGNELYNNFDLIEGLSVNPRIISILKN